MSKAETPYVETEMLLAALNDDHERFLELAGQESETGLRTLRSQLLMLHGWIGKAIRTSQTADREKSNA